MKKRWSVSVKLIRKILACRSSVVCLPAGYRKEEQARRDERKRTEGRACFSSVSSTLFLFLSFFFPPSLLRTRPIVPRGTEILNWKRPRAGATFIIPRSMIKIKSPAVSEAGNRCAGKSETRRKSEREPIARSVDGQSARARKGPAPPFPSSSSSCRTLLWQF